MSWVLLAFGFSFINAAFNMANRWFRMDGLRLNFWRMGLTVAALTPVMFILPWPQPSLFYPAAVLLGVGTLFSQKIRFNLAAQHNGRVAVMFIPVTVVVSFVLWALAEPTVLQDYMNQPLKVLGIFACLAVVMGAMLSLRRNDLGWRLFLVVAPLGVLHALMDVFNKLALESTGTWLSALVFIYVAMFAGFLLAGALLYQAGQHPDAPLRPPGMLRAASIMAALGLVGYFRVLNAVRMAPSPAYVSAVAMLSPVWMMVVHKLLGVRDDASPLAGLVMLLGALGLVMITQILH